MSMKKAIFFLGILLIFNIVNATEVRQDSLNFDLKEGESQLFNNQNVKITLIKINPENYNNGVYIYPDKSVTIEISQVEKTPYLEGEIIINFKPKSAGVTPEMEDFLKKNNLKVKRYLPTVDTLPKPISALITVPQGEEAEYIELVEKSSLVEDAVYSEFLETNITFGLTYPEIEHQGIKMKLLKIEDDSASFGIDFEDFSEERILVDTGYSESSSNIFQKFFRWIRNFFD